MDDAKGDLLTPPTAAAVLGAPVWAVRRAVDRLGLGRKVGAYRILSRADVERVRGELERKGTLTPMAVGA